MKSSHNYKNYATLQFDENVKLISTVRWSGYQLTFQKPVLKGQIKNTEM